MEPTRQQQLENALREYLKWSAEAERHPESSHDNLLHTPHYKALTALCELVLGVVKPA